ncbi:MAG: HXXEE domain-containing protein [archaeon]
MTKLNCKKLVLIQLFGVLHCVEEYFFGFSAWATEHFGTTTQKYYLISHLFIALIAAIIFIYAYRGYKLGIFFALVVQAVIFTNGLFHIFATVFWREYSPGMSAQILIIPITYLVFKKIYQSNIFSRSQIVYALLTGCVVSALIILSLFLDVRV